MNEEEFSETGKLFKELDDNGDGVLTIDEIKKGLEGKINASSNEID